MQEYRQYIELLVAQGGPTETDYAEFDHFVRRAYQSLTDGAASERELATLRSFFGAALSPNTMQGFALNKPHGYAGDFEIIDRIYQNFVSPDPHLANWDRYFHRHAAPQAVRNRKLYFKTLLDRHAATNRSLRVLKIASGPGRSMYEWLSSNPSLQVSFHCIEIDPKAISYASTLNHQHLDRITFTRMNALRFNPTEHYDLVWAAGIFDYFDDSVFVDLLRRLLSAVSPGGELVVGNFSQQNPSRPYMELVGNWHLHHRTGAQLHALAREAGASSNGIAVSSEPQGVNLFLHVSAAGNAPT